MRKIFIALWFLLPVAVAAYHFGPGQERVSLDKAEAWILKAQAQAEGLEYEEALASYDSALSFIPDGEKNVVRCVQLEKAKLQMNCSRLPDAYNSLTTLMDDLGGETAAPEKLVAETREALANSQFYMTWLMRLEGLPREVWEPEIQASRQNYRLLAEQAVSTGDSTMADKHRTGLESAIKLARMDLAELQGLPLPSQ